MKIIANLLRIKIEDMDRKKIMEEQEGIKSYAQVFMDTLEKIDKNMNEKLDNTDINVIIFISIWINNT